MADTKLTDKFCEQVKGFFDRALQARIEAFNLSRRCVLTDVSFRSPDHPHIVQKMAHEESLDFFPEGLALVDKLDRLIKTCGAIGIMSAEQAEIANKKLDRISAQIKSFSAQYPEENMLDVLFLPESRDDYRDEAGNVPLALTRQFLLGLADDPQRIIENVSVSWRKPDAAALKNARPYEPPKPY